MTNVASTEVDNDLDQTIDEVQEHLGVIVRRVRAAWKEAAASIHPDLQPVGYKILGTLVRLGEANAYTLAEVLETDKSVVSRQVRMLEDAGLVTSRADATDGRARVLSAAPAAVTLMRAARTQQQDRLREVLRSLPESEVRAFAKIIRILSER